MTAPLVPLVPIEPVAAVTVRAIVAVSLKLPDFPVMVTVDFPAAAEAVAASVRMQLAAVGPGPNDPETPVGSPVKLMVTVLEKPFCGVKVRVEAPLAPCTMLRAVGDADKVNVGGRETVSAMLVLAVRLPDVPVMVTVVVAAAAVLDAVNVTLRVVPAGPKVAVTPDGSPEAASATVPLNPVCAFTAILLAVLAPRLRLTLAGVAERVKLGGTAMVSAMVVLLVTEPDVPVTVTVEAPDVAFAAAFNVSVVVRADVEAGLNVAVTPAGRPAAEKATAPLNPPCGVTVMALAPLAPCKIVSAAGDGAMVKLAAGFTVRLIAAVL